MRIEPIRGISSIEPVHNIDMVSSVRPIRENREEESLTLPEMQEKKVNVKKAYNKLALRCKDMEEYSVSGETVRYDMSGLNFDEYG